MRNIQKILIHKRSGKKFYVKDLDNFHTEFGVIAKQDLSKEIAISSKDEEFSILPPLFSDLWETMTKGPQLVQRKDIGMILAKSGCNKNFKIVDAGGGTGSLCLSLANVCQEITVYETNPEHYDIVQRNISLFGFKNIHLKQQNIYNGIDEDNLDLLTLDLPEPWLVTEHAAAALKQGGHLVVYLPNLHQVKQFIDSTRKTKIQVIETLELLERQWKIEGKIMRPEFQMLGHTGFLTFCRRY